MKPFYKPTIYKQANAGFTVVELMVVIVIVGILASIGNASWQGWLTRQRVNSAQAEAFTALRQAQANAKREKRVWQACFKDNGTRLQWSVQPLPAGAANDTNCFEPGENPNITVVWNNVLEESSDVVGIDTANTSLRPAGGGTYSVKFQYKGLLVENPSQIGRITFGTRQTPGQVGVREGTRRCVRVETLLGAMIADSDEECKKT